MQRCFLSLVLALVIFPFSLEAITKESTEEPKNVLLAILARNKAHTLPPFLQCIENLDYPKDHICIYINTNNNSDNTKEILDQWRHKNQQLYRLILVDDAEHPALSDTKPHEWTPDRFSVLGKIRNLSLQRTLQCNCDYYFTADCDNFIAPCTLKTLISKDKPIVAPMLMGLPKYRDPFCNFFTACDPYGYYEYTPDYSKILDRQKIGTFRVPVVHQTYLIKKEYIDDLNYLDESPYHEFVVFSRIAREKGIDQYICNEELFGTFLHYPDTYSLEDEKEAFEDIYRNHKNGNLYDLAGFDPLLGKIAPEDPGYFSYRTLIERMEKRKVKTIVETRTAPGGRGEYLGNGSFTAVFAHWISQNNGHYFAVNNHKASLGAVNIITSPFKHHLSAIHDTPQHFLHNFDDKIDFLLLHSTHFDTNNPLSSQKRSLEELQAAYDKLSLSSIVMIDKFQLTRVVDPGETLTDFDPKQIGEQRGKLVVEFLIEKGWRILAQEPTLLNSLNQIDR